jgi:hypothetical protein
MSREHDEVCERLLRRLGIRATQPTLQGSVKPLVHSDDFVTTPLKQAAI